MGVRRLLNLKDPVIQHLCKLSSNRDYRNSKQQLVVAGTKLVQDLGQRHSFHDLLMPVPNDPAAAGLRAENRYEADPRALRRIARLTSFEGLVGTVDLPKAQKDVLDLRLVLALDYIEDAGLLGTLLRAAVAFQWQAVFFLPNCVDPFHPRCVRASQGALLDLPFYRGKMEDLQKLCRRRRLTLCVSNASGVDVGGPDYEPPPSGVALLLREEYAAPWGPPQQAMKVKIPDPFAYGGGGTEAFDPRSLDVAVAGGILMHHIKHFHYPHFARSPALASPGARG